MRKLDQELLKFKLELEADNRGITEILEKHSLEMDQPGLGVSGSNLKENRHPKKHVRKSIFLGKYDKRGMLVRLYLQQHHSNYDIGKKNCTWGINFASQWFWIIIDYSSCWRRGWWDTS